MFLENYVDEAEYDDFFIDDWDVESRDYSDVSDESIDFSEGVFDILSDMINSGELDEKFTSYNSARVHFREHCVGKKSKKSHRSNVVYDFVKFSDYFNHEAEVDLKIKAAKYSVTDLFDTETLIKMFHKIFEGSTTVKFELSCGFKNSMGRCTLAVNSWANDYTTNWTSNNTVDFVVRTPDGLTITIFPIDSDYLKSKLNNTAIKSGITTEKLF